MEDDLPHLVGKADANLLRFSLLLKFFDLEGRFPEDAGEVPQPAIEYVAGLVKVASQAWADYSWDGRTIKLGVSGLTAPKRRQMLP